jgi:hypothetical protein
MKPLVTRLAAGLACTTLALGGLFVLAGGASAATPPFEPDSNAYGTIALYDASGAAVTSGSLSDDPVAAYAAGSVAAPPAGEGGQPPADYTRGTLMLAGPQPGENSQSWPTEQLTASTKYPLTAGPTNLVGLQDADGNYLPVETGASTNITIAYALTTFAPLSNPPAGYLNVYQLRLYQSGPGLGASGYFEDMDILVNPTAGTWQEIYPLTSSATNTTTTLAATPTSGAVEGQAVTLTATVTPSVAGTVQFANGSTHLGKPVALDTTTGKASYTFTPAAAATDSLTATFTPTDAGSYNPSTSTALPYTIGVAKPTVTGTKVSGTVRVGQTVSCSATVHFATSVTYSWLLNGSQVATGTSTHYAIPGADYAKKLGCEVKATDSAGTTTATSATAKVALGPALKDKVKPKLSGSHAVGKTEKVSTGSWSPKATKYSYQWYANGKKIHGATKSSFKVAKADKGKKLTCKVTAHATGYAAGSVTTSSVRIT